MIKNMVPENSETVPEIYPVDFGMLCCGKSDTCGF